MGMAGGVEQSTVVPKGPVAKRRYRLRQHATVQLCMRNFVTNRTCFKALCVSGLALAHLALTVSVARARDKTDIVVLGNGDRITCEVEALARGRLTVKTDSMGTLQIEWDDILELTISARFEVELETGEKFISSLAAAPGDGNLNVVGDTDVVLPHASVVRIREIGEGFWSQLEGSVDVGFSFTKASDAKQWSFSGEVIRRTERIRNTSVKGGAKLDHRGGGKLDH